MTQLSDVLRHRAIGFRNKIFKKVLSYFRKKIKLGAALPQTDQKNFQRAKK
jgi:hypothetical protein